MYIYPSKQNTLTQCADLMLVQRRRRWANIKPALVQRFVFAGTPLYYFFTSYMSSNKKHIYYNKVTIHHSNYMFIHQA